MSMLAEFKEFAVKGNAVDLAVGVIIGGAFGKIVDSIVGDLIMPVVGAMIGTGQALAETGVDRISIGTLTKDVKAIDFSMRLQELA